MIFVQQIEQIFTNPPQPIESDQIFIQYISDRPDHLNLWKMSQKIKKNVCNKEITEQQLAFRCITCSDDISHLICSQCFNIQEHQNHNFEYIADVGNCSCGRLTLIQNCETHKILEEQKLNQIDIIPEDLAIKIEQFIMAASSVYYEIMKQIEAQWSNFRLPIMQLYHLCEKFNIEQIKQTIDKKINYKEYYNLLVKSQFFHQMIFNLIDWLTQDREQFQNLIANIFQKQLPNYEHSLYEGLIRYQTLYEASSPELPIFIFNLIQRLTSNQEFNEFICKVNLRIFSSFFLLAKNTKTKSIYSVYDYIDLLTLQQQDIDPQYEKNNKKQIDEFNYIVENYLQELKQTNFTSYSYIQCEYVKQFKETINEIIMKTIVEQLDQIQLFSFLENAYCLIHVPLGEMLCYPWYGIKFLGSKFRSENFDKFNMISLKNTLGVDYDKFKNQNADLNLIKNFNHQQYLLTKLINCFGKATPSVIPNKKFDYKQSIDEEVELKYYLHFEGELIKEIQTGIISLFSDSESTEQLQNNLIQVILVQTYNLIKNNRNIGVKFETQLAQIFNQYVYQKDNSNIKLVKARKIYCYLIKNASILDKLFITTLCLYLSIKEYKEPQQFLQFLQYIFDDSIEVIKENFQQILQRCIQKYVTIWMMADDKIDQLYYGYGENNQRSKLESIDTAFGKLYIYLFGETGLLDVYRAINNMLIPNITFQCTVTYLYLLRLMTSDIDIYNSSIYYFREQEILPIVLQQALQKIIQNIMNIEIQATLETIQLRFEDFGIIFPSLNTLVLNFLEIDETTKLLKLKSQYPPLFDPILFAAKPNFRKLFNQKLNERGIQTKDILFGNGILWNIKQYHQENQYLIQKNILNHLSSKQNLIDNLQFLSKYKNEEEETFIFIQNLFLAASYFRLEELKSNFILILQLLKKIQQESQYEPLQQYYVTLIEQFQTFSFLQDDQQSIKIQNKEEQCLIQQNDLINNKSLQNNDYQQCDYCKLQIQDKYCISILLSKRNNYKHFPMPEILLSQLINQNHNLLQLSVNGCSHIYHKNCVLLNTQQSLFNQLPRWYKQACRVCNHSYNIEIPLNKSITQLDVQLFNKNLIDCVNENELWDYLVKSNQNQYQNIIIEIYLQIIIDLLQQLFIDIKRFRDLNRIIVLNQIINLLEQTTIINLSSPLKIQPKEYKFDIDISIFFNIIYSIYNNIIINQNKQQLKNEIIIIVLNLKQDQYKQILLDIFNISTQEVQEFNNQSYIQIQESDPYIEYNQQIFDIYSKKLNSNLGQNLAEFHKKYFVKGCDICKNYNTQFENNKDILVCLICEKVFCIRQCTKSKFGNLNEHALQEHSGGLFYVSLITGQITLIQYPISLHSVYDLFYNEKFGLQKLNSIIPKKRSQFIVNQQMIQKIAEIMIYNLYGIQIYNKKVLDCQNITTDGGL
ncbi:unnamed protein product [Paramecium primaurelia]|uniref:UBR-type domain-containing protein n=1 Tax=Paramecium primaurelia TaxID=5886 RepID=A0A8S1K2D2_PARPR|nr:unnamed protein product [Paramecium primaurelia]